MTNIASYEVPEHLITRFTNLLEELAEDIVKKTHCPMSVAEIGATSIIHTWIESTVQFIEERNKPQNNDLN